ncbi:MAG: ABC transporter ATP-binding protein [Planctomycetes bacterium]|nr:ABC transporter ATP-binding protein [Planctomycetota bacterium]
MSNLARVLRLTLRHRMTVVASILCSLGVALLWGGSIMAIVPIVDGVMHGKSIPNLLDDWNGQATTRIVELDAEIEVRRQQLADAKPKQQQALRAQMSSLESLRSTSASWRSFYERLSPPAKRWLPVTPFGTLVVICLTLLGSTLLKSLFRIAGTFFTARLGHLTGFELRKEFYRRTLRLDLETFRKTSPGDLMNRFTTDVGCIAQGTRTVFGMAIREPLKMIACLAGAAWISWQLLLMTIVIAPLGAYTIHWLAKALKRANRRALEELSSVYEHLEETFSGIKVIKAFTMESRERSRFHQSSKQYYRRSMKIAFYDSLVSPITESIGVAIIVAVIMAGGYLVLNRETHLFGIRVSAEPLSHGMLTAFYGMLAGASDPLRRLSGLFNSLQRAAASSDRVYELLDRQSTISDPPVPVKLPASLGRIHFRDVSFSYQRDELVLDHVDLHVERGETIAIVGPNGCGKSTLMNLVARFYDPVEGAVTLDGIDLRNVRVRDLRSRIGVVSQETLLFDDTVANNIRYGSLEATEAQVIEAARQAHAHEFITEKLADGYQTLCGSGGNRLSGGQRQRLALARAILRDPEILILDEATSQIDVESERLIHEVLDKFVQGRTVFMITHRPSTLQLADRIVVMDQGRIVDIGTLDELSQRCELFRRLAHLDYRQSA